MIELGQKLRITYTPSWSSSTKDIMLRTKEGTVIYKNDFYYTVQFDNYRESFLYKDKRVRVEVLDGNKRTA